MSCERACPSQVDYAGLLAATRELTRPSSPRLPAWMRAVLDRPRWLGALVGLARSARVERWLSPIARRIAPRSGLADLLAELPARPARPRYPVAIPPTRSRGRIGLMRGCVASVFDHDTLAASRHMLERLGYEVIEPSAAGCCGAMALHAGDAERAHTQARSLRNAFEAARVDAIVVSASGCFGTLRDLSFDGSPLAVHEIHNFIAADRAFDSLRFRPLAQRAALHLPCTAVNVARAATAITRLLARIPQLQILVLPEQPRCCGAAGTYFLQHAEIARSLRGEKLDQCDALGPDLLLTANIGCRIHLDNGLRGRGSSVPVLHPVTLLARQLDAAKAGVQPESARIAGI